MKLYSLLIRFCIVVTFFACNPTKEKIENDQEWETITITSNSSVEFILSNDHDSSIAKVYHVVFYPPKPAQKVKIDTLKIKFSRAEKDTVAYLVNDLIVHPKKIKSLCTEFDGTIALVMYYKQFTISGKYSSTCDWTSLSNETKQLNSILKRGLKRRKSKILK